MVGPMLLTSWPALAAEIREVPNEPERWQGMRRRSRPLIGMLLCALNFWGQCDCLECSITIHEPCLPTPPVTHGSDSLYVALPPLVLSTDC